MSFWIFGILTTVACFVSSTTSLGIGIPRYNFDSYLPENSASGGPTSRFILNSFEKPRLGFLKAPNSLPIVTAPESHFRGRQLTEGLPKDNVHDGQTEMPIDTSLGSPSQTEFGINKPYFSRYGKIIRMRSQRNVDSPFMDLSHIILPLEQRARWRKFNQPEKVGGTAKANQVVYDLLVN